MTEFVSFIILFLVSALGGFIQRVTGFGYGIFVMLFFPYLILPHTAAAAVSTLVSCVTSTYNAVIYRKHIPWKLMIPAVIGSFIMVPVAVRFSTHISGDVFKKLLGVVLILLSIYFLFFSGRIKIQSSAKNGVLAGGISGVLSGLFSTGGPPIVLYLMNASLENMTYFASTQFFFGLTGIYSTCVRAVSGIITLGVLMLTAICFAGAILGNTVGKYVFHKLSAQNLKKIIYIFMILSGITMML